MLVVCAYYNQNNKFKEYYNMLSQECKEVSYDFRTYSNEESEYLHNFIEEVVIEGNDLNKIYLVMEKINELKLRK